MKKAFPAMPPSSSQARQVAIEPTDHSSAPSPQRWTPRLVKQLIRTPVRLLQDPVWSSWFQTRGGMSGVHAYLRRLPLSRGEHEILQLLLQQPRESVDVYIQILHISRASYFKRLNALLSLLSSYLDDWVIGTATNSSTSGSGATLAHPAALERAGLNVDKTLVSGLESQLFSTHLERSHAHQHISTSNNPDQAGSAAAWPISRHHSNSPHLLIEREEALLAITHFLDQCATCSRTILRIVGSSGSGRSHMLAVSADLAARRGANVLQLDASNTQNADALLLSLLQPAHTGAQAEYPQLGGPTSLQQTSHDNTAPLTVVCIDNLPLLDIEVLGALRRLLQSGLTSSLGLVYTAESGDVDVLGYPVQMCIELQPLTAQGVQRWLMMTLGWNPPPGFAAWLQRETGGLPLRIQRGICQLLEQAILQWTPQGWDWAEGRMPLLLDVERGKGHVLPPHNLPMPTMPFIGRVREIIAIANLLKRSRLVTIVGLGGIGKSRLALQLGVTLRRWFPQGVYLVPLSATTASQQILPAIAHTLQIKDEGGLPIAETLVRYLADKHLLLILDNAEHLLDGIGQLSMLLEHTAHLTLLVTSRERLNIVGEAIFTLEGLAYPVEGTIEPSEAAQLFIQQASSVDPSFSYTQDTAAAVARICQLVQGMPLAIELAAAWTRLIPCQQIVCGISERLDFLTSHLRSAPERHHSMRAVFDYSWNAMSQAEQRGFRRLAVFCGGLTYEAASVVADVSLPMLATLLDRSLLRRTPSGAYEIHVLLRQYAEEHLAQHPDEWQEVRRRHAQYYLALAERIATQERDPQMTKPPRLDYEHANIVAAFRWALDQREMEKNDFATALHYYAHILPLLPPREQGTTLLELYEVHEHLGDVAQANRTIDALLRVAKQIGDPILIAQGLCARGVILKTWGQFAEALMVLGEAERNVASTNDQQLLLRVLREVGSVKHLQGRYSEALSDCERCVQLAISLGDHQSVCHTLNSIGKIYFDQGKYTEAREANERGLRWATEHDCPRIVPALLGNLGVLHEGLGEDNQAFGYYERKLDLAVRGGQSHEIANALGNMGVLYRYRGMSNQAIACFRASLAIYGAAWYVRFIIWELRHLAILASHAGQKHEAAGLLSRCIALARWAKLPYQLVFSLYRQAELDVDQQRYAAAHACLSEALTISLQRGMRKRQFDTQVLILRIEVLLGHRSPSEAIAQLMALHETWPAEQQRAAIDYTIWQIDHTRERERESAAERYCVLYTHSPRAEYCQRYEELTGKTLPPGLLLPEPPSVVSEYVLDMDTLLHNIDRRLEQNK